MSTKNCQSRGLQKHGNPLFSLSTKMSSEEIQISVPLLLEFSSNLSASPRIFARLSKLIENEDTGLDYVASIVKMDPSLVAHILRVTNSTYYRSAIKLNEPTAFAKAC